MSWEIRREEKNGTVVWQSRDADGRRIYAANRRMADGTAIEPRSGYYSIKAAREAEK